MKNRTEDTNDAATESSSSTKQRKLMPQDKTDAEVDEAEVVDDDFDSISSPGSVSVISGSGHSEIARKKQSTLDFAFQNQKSFQDGGTKAAEFTNYLLFMIAKDNLPFSTTEKEGFKTFMKIVAPLYKIPGRKKVTTLIEEKYKFLSGMIKESKFLLNIIKFMFNNRHLDRHVKHQKFFGSYSPFCIRRNI